MPDNKKQLARYLRSNMQKPEILLWTHLQGRRTGHLINRQYRIDPYIIDFFCRKLRVVIEIDGKIHQIKKSSDEERDLQMINQGMLVIRIPASHVMRSPYESSLRIKDILDQRQFELEADA